MMKPLALNGCDSEQHLSGGDSRKMIIGIILSAGESKRMGTPKQLMPWGKTIILQRVVDMDDPGDIGLPGR
jgi:hypothetical protein